MNPTPNLLGTGHGPRATPSRPLATLPGLFVTGTDTGVGKTRVASAIARSLTDEGRRVGVLKPAATGATRDGDAWHCADAEALIEAIGGGAEVDRVAPLIFEASLAPPVAARFSGESLHWPRVLEAVGGALSWWAGRADVMIVEGVGGLLCPLAEGTTAADLAIALDYPLVLVARRGLGTLNHTLLTVEAARLRGLRLAGIVLNGAEPTADPLAEATNPGELARRLDGIPLLADLPFCADPKALWMALKTVDWYDRAHVPRYVGVHPIDWCQALIHPDPGPLPGARRAGRDRGGRVPMPEEILCRWCGTQLPDRGKELLCLACGTWFPGQDRPSTPASAASTCAAPLASSDALMVLEEDGLTGGADLLATSDRDLKAIGRGAPVLGAASPTASEGRPGEERSVGPPAAAAPWACERREADSSPAIDTLTTTGPTAMADGGPAWHGPASTPGVAPPEDAPAEGSAGFPALDFNRAPGPGRSREAGRKAGEEDQEDEFEEVHGPPWVSALLLSYASAMTIACIWLWTHPRPAGRPPEEFRDVAVDTRPDPGSRADRTAKVEPAPPLPAERLTTLGEPLRVGALEFTPLDVRKGKVTLVVERFDGQQEQRDAGDDALHLRVRFRNVSNDLIFAPLDEAFVRERDRELPDSFIEAADGERIYTYRLPVASERTITGQKFQELKPGETMETIVVSDTDAVARARGSLTWRLRLRTGDQKTDVVGVRFAADAIP